ncbi:general transcription factor IIF subunit 2-like isoform X1 [Tripterygium wilfordii]|uniref:General transcription factor IIF subunit 2-like isoform X1 n=1 Tax=Tripterygium wilfordii TaxID=458696 RepID=A0A7J7D8Z0_TRIWF|nr:general transcription factor IIF subunit 2-like isoform X1 [Tripterygium wilfordii]KAF5742526.1 general transcription factor IIF subunit 2-like isoform X1 [Tripterygium wilfordii]
MDERGGSSDNSGGYGKHGGGFLETSKSDRAMWLMKCPALVSRSMKGPDDPSLPVAKVVLSIDPLRNEEDSSTQFTMELAGPESGNAPKRYAMEISKDFVPLSVFSESSQGKLSVEGKILNKFDMRPHAENLENYGKLCRERTNQYMTKIRQIQVIGNDRGTHMRPMPGMIAPGFTQEKKKPPPKGSEMKRTRRDRGEMEEIMFKLFERQPNWTLRQLIQETDQPEQFLKDLLKDLCVYNNKGTNQGSYELKPEYKRSGEDATSK